MNPVLPPGPLQKKLLETWRTPLGRTYLKELLRSKETLETVNKIEKALPKAVAGDLEATLKVYVETLNLLTIFLETFSGIPSLQKAMMVLGKEQEVYLPSYPPESPITLSLFTYINTFDQGFGKSEETLSEISAGFLRSVGHFPELLPLIDILRDSSLGLFEVVEGSKTYGTLLDVHTGKQFQVFFTSGYTPEKGETLFTRLLPQLLPGPVPDLASGKALSIITPYIFRGTGSDSWGRFLRQNFSGKTTVDREAIARFFKWGRRRNEWLDYFMDGYAGHTNSAIFVAGIPGVPLSLPCSSEALDVQADYSHFSESLPPCPSCKHPLTPLSDFGSDGTIGPLCLSCHNAKVAKARKIPRLPHDVFPIEVAYDTAGKPHVFFLSLRLETDRNALTAREITPDPEDLPMTFSTMSKDRTPDISALHAALMATIPQALPVSIGSKKTGRRRS
ncbi:MAG: hypothetical protein ACYDBP_12465 [Leptospirales bacterium]